MAIERRNPDGLHATPGYHHLTTVTAGTLVFLAGQVPLDRAGELVGAGDVLAQADQVAANTLTALRAAGLTPSDVVRTVIYVVGDQPTLAAVWRRLHETALAPAFTTASTLLGVAALGFTGQLVELDVTAAAG
jgi:enamine deaminase RidA (YjgF/YER057c/UK114 family)